MYFENTKINKNNIHIHVQYIFAFENSVATRLGRVNHLVPNSTGFWALINANKALLIKHKGCYY